MRHRTLLTGLILSLLFVFSSHAQQDHILVFKGPCLGQEPPGMTLGDLRFDFWAITKSAFRPGEKKPSEPYGGNAAAEESSRKIIFRLTVDLPGKLAVSYCKGEYLVRCGDEILISGTIDLRDLSAAERRVFEKEVYLPGRQLAAEEITWRFRGELYDARLNRKFEPMVMSVEKWNEAMEGIGYDIVVSANGDIHTQKRVYRKTLYKGQKLKTANPFPPLQGPFKVGVQTYFWIDPQREEIFTTAAGDKRHLFVQVWYPADVTPAARVAPYVQNPEIYGPAIASSDMIRLTTNSYLRAQLSRAKSTYPVIIFSHGLNANVFSDTFLLEQLASHGYVVFGIGHTFFNGVEKFPDGYHAARDFFPKMQKRSSQEESYRQFAEFTHRYTTMPLVDDTKFVIKQIAALHEEEGSFFQGRLDMERMGICGWSMGGVSAAQMCNDESRMRAGINFDGTINGIIAKNGVRKPFMLMKSEKELPEVPGDEFKKMIEVIQRDEGEFIARSKQLFRVTIKGSKHTNFSDYPLYDDAAKGEIDTKLCHEIIVALTLDFFDRYVLSRTGVELEKRASRYPMVLIEKF